MSRRPEGVDYWSDVKELLPQVITPNNPAVRGVAESIRILPRYAGCEDCGQPRQFVIFQSWKWINNNIAYQISKEWKTPEETIRSGIGDCEDMTALLASLLIAGEVKDVNFVAGKYREDGRVEWHTWVESRGKILDPTASVGEVNPSRYIEKARYKLKG